jgi:hypothetical protein
MKLSDASQAAARLALVNDKSRKGFEDQLRKWFSTYFVKGANLGLIRSVYQAGAYNAFAQLLAEAADAERATILAKLDKHRPDMQMRPKAEIMGHLEGLASGRIEAAIKPKPPTKPKAAKSAKKSVGIISGSKY